MEYLLDKTFPFGLEKYLLDKKGITGKGLKIMAQIKNYL